MLFKHSLSPSVRIHRIFRRYAVEIVFCFSLQHYCGGIKLHRGKYFELFFSEKRGSQLQNVLNISVGKSSIC